MANYIRFIIFSILALLLLASPAQAESRIALVIGNSNYSRLQSLSNPSNDARLMTETLSKLGFEVISAIDADRVAMARAMRKFGKALRVGGKNTVGLFYYAGHGVQARGVNYLIPLNADIEDEDDLDVEAVSASNVLSRMETAGNALNLVILDACRNNPYKGTMRSNSRGLTRVQAASGSLVAFAAAPGQVAADGTGENSPYTTALVEAMQVPGLTVERMFKRVRISVEAQTGRQQTPWEESSLRGDFYFKPGKLTQTPIPIAIPSPQPVLSKAAKEWTAIQNTRSVAVLKSFVKRYPNSVYAGYAKTTINERTQPQQRLPSKPKNPQNIDPRSLELSYWNSIQNSRNPALFRDYLARNPNGYFAVIAKEKLSALKNAKTKKKQLKLASLPFDTTLERRLQSMENPRKLTFILQKQLRRVGCYRGGIDGQWGRGSAAALNRFNKYAATDLPADEPSKSAIKAVNARTSKVCPRMCGSGYKRRGGKCVRLAVTRSSSSQSTSKSTSQKRSTPKHKTIRGGCRAGNIEACRLGCSFGKQRACAKLRYLGG